MCEVRDTPSKFTDLSFQLWMLCNLQTERRREVCFVTLDHDCRGVAQTLNCVMYRGSGAVTDDLRQ